VFNDGAIIITFKLLFIKNNLCFFEFVISKFLDFFLKNYILFEFAPFFPFFSQQELPSYENLKPKKHFAKGGEGGRGG
jgi:hypothetical protein